MIELAVGTRFRYKGNIYKVVETEHDYCRCSECDISIGDCSMMKCGSIEREDGKYVCFRWMGYTEYTEDIEDAEIAQDAFSAKAAEIAKDAEIAGDVEDMEETMDNVTTGEECCNKENTLAEEIGELKIEESLKERILAKIEELEKRNDAFANVINRYRYNTQRLERTIVMLATMVADKSKSITEDE